MTEQSETKSAKKNKKSFENDQTFSFALLSNLRRNLAEQLTSHFSRTSWYSIFVSKIEKLIPASKRFLNRSWADRRRLQLHERLLHISLKLSIKKSSSSKLKKESSVYSRPPSFYWNLHVEKQLLVFF